MKTKNIFITSSSYLILENQRKEILSFDSYSTKYVRYWSVSNTVCSKMMENCIVFIWQNRDGLCLVRVRDWKGQQLLCLFVLPVLSPFIQICSIIKNTCSNYTISLYIMILKDLIKTILCKMKNAWRLFLYELQTLSLLLLCLQYTWIKCWFSYGNLFGIFACLSGCSLCSCMENISFWILFIRYM